MTSRRSIKAVTGFGVRASVGVLTGTFSGSYTGFIVQSIQGVIVISFFIIHLATWTRPTRTSTDLARLVDPPIVSLHLPFPAPKPARLHPRSSSAPLPSSHSHPHLAIDRSDLPLPARSHSHCHSRSRPDV